MKVPRRMTGSIETRSVGRRVGKILFGFPASGSARRGNGTRFERLRREEPEPAPDEPRGERGVDARAALFLGRDRHAAGILVTAVVRAAVIEAAAAASVRLGTAGTALFDAVRALAGMHDHAAGAKDRCDEEPNGADRCNCVPKHGEGFYTQFKTGAQGIRVRTPHFLFAESDVRAPVSPKHARRDRRCRGHLPSCGDVPKHPPLDSTRLRCPASSSLRPRGRAAPGR